MTGYFILTGNPIHIEGPLSWAQVSERITPSRDGDDDTYYGTLDGFFDEVPEQDSGYFERVHGKKINHDEDNRILIIKGEIVVPKSAEVVTRFEEP
jgi:hypothetical protein